MFALLAPMLYCDAIVDAMTKGLGKQKICVRYNIITSAMDVALHFILLPQYGMIGYFLSFFITHLINFILSLRLLSKIVDKIISRKIGFRCIAAASFSIILTRYLTYPWISCLAYIILFTSLLTLLGVIGEKDKRWLKGLLFPTIAD